MDHFTAYFLLLLAALFLGLFIHGTVKMARERKAGK